MHIVLAFIFIFIALPIGVVGGLCQAMNPKPPAPVPDRWRYGSMDVETPPKKKRNGLYY